MNQDKFVALFIEQFDLLDEEVHITPLTEFRTLEDWDSLVALSVIAMIDDEYEVAVTGDEIRDAKTVNDLFVLVSRKTTDA